MQLSFSRPAQLVGLGAIVAASLFAGAAARAQECTVDGGTDQDWRAREDFSATANPNLVWTYGYTSTAAVGAVTASVAGTRNGLPTWEGPASWGWSAAIFNNSAVSVLLSPGLVIAPSHLFLHPAGNGRKSVLRFTAPQPGCYQMSASFLLVDEQNGSVDLTVRADGITIHSDGMAGSGDSSSAAVESMFLSACDTIETFVGFGNGNFSDDSVDTDIRVLRVSAGVDTNSDGTPDACPPDSDNDGVVDPFDNCPSVPNSD